MQCKYDGSQLLAYVDNELTSAEIIKVEKHLKCCNVCKEEVNELRNVTSLLNMLPDLDFSDETRLKLSTKLKETAIETYDIPVKTPFWKRFKILIPATATFMCLALVFTGFFTNNSATTKPVNLTPIKIAMAKSASLELEVNSNIYINGEQLQFNSKSSNKIILKEEDHITVAQGSNAKITYPGDIYIDISPGSKAVVYNRWLHLEEGNGFFKLGKQHKEFQVTSPTVTVTVIGTTFTVNVNQDGKSEVSLIEGKVMFETSKGKNLMQSGQTLQTQVNGTFTLEQTKNDINKEIIFRDRRNATGN